MSEMLMEILKVIVMLALIMVMRYGVPLANELIGAAKMAEIRKWAKEAVEAAQQVHDAEPGAERKKIVVDIMRGILLRKNIDMSEKELDTLIEAAVKAMKMQDKNNAGASVKIFGT